MCLNTIVVLTLGMTGFRCSVMTEMSFSLLTSFLSKFHSGGQGWLWLTPGERERNEPTTWRKLDFLATGKNGSAKKGRFVKTNSNVVSRQPLTLSGSLLSSVN